MPPVPPIPTTPNEAVEVLEWCARNIGPGFHPDTPAHDYIVLATGEPTLTDAEAIALNLALDEVFHLLDDPYAVTNDLFTQTRED